MWHWDFLYLRQLAACCFQPLFDKQRSSTQTVAEGIVSRCAFGVAGVILLVFSTALHFEAVTTLYAFLGIAVLWFWTIFQLSRRYPLVMSERSEEEPGRVYNIVV
jgi:ATP/ADP translocase